MEFPNISELNSPEVRPVEPEKEGFSINIKNVEQDLRLPIEDKNMARSLSTMYMAYQSGIKDFDEANKQDFKKLSKIYFGNEMQPLDAQKRIRDSLVHIDEIKNTESEYDKFMKLDKIGQYKQAIIDSDDVMLGSLEFKDKNPLEKAEQMFKDVEENGTFLPSNYNEHIEKYKAKLMSKDLKIVIPYAESKLSPRAINMARKTALRGTVNELSMLNLDYWKREFDPRVSTTDDRAKAMLVSLPEKERDAFIALVGALNPAVDMSFVKELGERVNQASENIMQSLARTRIHYAEWFDILEDPGFAPGTPDYEEYQQVYRIGKASQIRFKDDRGYVANAVLTAASITPDLLAALGAGLPTMGVGTLVYSAARIQGNAADTLVYEYGVDQKTAMFSSILMSLPYAVVEKMQIKGLEPGKIKLQREATETLHRYVMRVALTFLKENGGKAFVESGEEGIQKFIEEGLYLAFKENKEWDKDFIELMEKSAEEFTSSLGPMFIVSGPGSAMNASSNLYNGMRNGDGIRADIIQRRIDIMKDKIEKGETPDLLKTPIPEEDFKAVSQMSREDATEYLVDKGYDPEETLENIYSWNSMADFYLKNLKEFEEAGPEDIEPGMDIESVQEIAQMSLPEDSGIADVVVYENSQQMIEQNEKVAARLNETGGDPESVDAFLDEDKIYIVADKMTPGMVDRKVRHEVFHRKLENYLGDDYENFLNNIAESADLELSQKILGIAGKYASEINKAETKQAALAKAVDELAALMQETKRKDPTGFQKVIQAISDFIKRVFGDDTWTVEKFERFLDDVEAGKKKSEIKKEAPVETEATEEMKDEEFKDIPPEDVIETLPLETSDFDYPIESVNVSDVLLDPDTFQFKGDVDANGIVESQQLEGEWDEIAGGVFTLWQSVDGKIYVVNGHHRFDLARRKGVEKIKAIVLKESEGITAGKARSIGAEINIKEGQGTVTDHATYIRENPEIDEAAAEKKGLLARALGRQGFMIGRYANNDVYSAYKSGKINAAKAAVIAEKGKFNDAKQALGLKMAKNSSPEQIANTLEALDTMDIEVKQAEQMDLFGFDDSAIRQAEIMGKAATTIQEGIIEDRKILKQAQQRKSDLKLKQSGVAKKYDITEDNFNADLVRAINQIDYDLQRWKSWSSQEDLREQVKGRVGGIKFSLAIPEIRAEAASLTRDELKEKGYYFYEGVEFDKRTSVIDGVEYELGGGKRSRGIWRDGFYGPVYIGQSWEDAKTDIAERKETARYFGRDEVKFSIAFHGSPFEIDKFRSSRIGTGEGVQAFGWGLYFTQRKDIAEWYAKNLAKSKKQERITNLYQQINALNTDALIKGKLSNSDKNKIKDYISLIPSEDLTYRGERAPLQTTFLLEQFLEKKQGSRLLNTHYLIRRLNEISEESKGKKKLLFFEDKTSSKINDIIQIIKKNTGIEKAKEIKQKLSQEKIRKEDRFVLEVNLTPNENEYLLWDKKISEQPSFIKERLKSFNQNKTGEQIYKEISNNIDAKETSLKLLKRGIRGVKYLTGDSRAKGKGDFNYVIFDETDIEIRQEIKFSLAPPVDSPEFKAWFGDSKVVDENGSPKVVYHGTGDQFTEFRIENDGFPLDAAIFFSESKDVAYQFADSKSRDGRIIQAYIKIENPLYIGRIEDEMTIYELWDRLGLSKETIPESEKNQRQYKIAVWEYYVENADIIQTFKKLGYDGLIGEERRKPMYAVFDNKNVKSADYFTYDNEGNRILTKDRFDPNNPDIRFALSGERSVVAHLAALIAKGNNVTTKRTKTMLDKVGSDADALDILNQAARLAQGYEAEKAETFNEVYEAMRKAEHEDYYKNQMERVYERGTIHGEAYAKAEKEWKEATKKRKERLITGRKGISVQELTKNDEDIFELLKNAVLLPDKEKKATKPKTDEEYQQEKERKEGAVKKQKDLEEKVRAMDAKEIDALLNRVESLVENKLNSEGVKYRDKSDPIFRQEYKLTMRNALNRLNKDLTASARKEQIMRKIAAIEKISGYMNIRNSAGSIVDLINKHRIKETKADLISQINKAIKRVSKGPLSQNKEIEKRKIDPKVEEWIKRVKKAMSMTPEKVDERIDEIEAIYNNPKVHKSELEIHQLTQELKALNQYGALKELPLDEVENARDTLLDEITEGVKIVEDAFNRRQARLQPKRQIEIKAQGPARDIDETTTKHKADMYLVDQMSLKNKLADMIRFATGKERTMSQELHREFDTQLNIALQRKQTEIRNHMEKLGIFLEEQYGMRATKAIEMISRKQEQYRKHSRENRLLSKDELMQIYVQSVQGDYAEQAKQYDLDAIAKEFTKADWALILYLRKWYADERQPISDVLEQVTGMKIYAPDLLYMPGTIERPEGGLSEKIIVTRFIPSAYIRRKSHKYGFDEDAGMLDTWRGKMEENSHFKHYAELMRETRGVYASPDVTRAIQKAHGKDYHAKFLEHITDAINDRPMTEIMRVPIIDVFREYYALSKLSWNLAVMTRQPTSISAFIFEIGPARTAKYMASAFTSEGFDAMKDILESDQRKNRFYFGNSEAVRNALSRGKDPNILKRFYRMGMWTNSLGDIIPSLIVGQGIYRSKFQEYNRQGYNDVDAKEAALSDTFSIIQSTQQSSEIKDMSGWQRRAGSIGRLAGMFSSTVRQYAEYEIRAIRDVQAGVDGAWQKFFQVTAVNHILLPGAYSLAGMMFKWLLGDEPDEEDIWTMAFAMLTGPLSGLIVLGAMAQGTIDKIRGKYRSSIIPIMGVIDDATALWKMGVSPVTDAELAEELDKLLKSNFAPYRHGKQLYENRIK